MSSEFQVQLMIFSMASTKLKINWKQKQNINVDASFEYFEVLRYGYEIISKFEILRLFTVTMKR